MLHDMRIRLEGRLEEVERAAAALETGLEHSEQGHFTLLREALKLDTSEARTHVAKLAPREYELQVLLRRWERLHARVARTVSKRARIMGVPEVPLQGALDALAAERVAYEEVVRNRAVWLPIVALAVMSVLALKHTHQLMVVAVYAAVGFFAVLSHVMAAARVIVTDRRLIIGANRVPLVDVRCLIIERMRRRSARPFLLTVQLRNGSRLEQRMPHVPRAFVKTMEAAGVEVTQHAA
jgi:hypothetical protein